MTFRLLLRTGAATLAAVVSLSFGSAQSSSSGRSYYIESGRDQGRLGVVVRDVTDELKKEKKLSVDYGAYVLDVVEESPAEKAEIKEGDVIVRFDGEKIDESGDLTRLVRKTKPRKAVPVEIVRKGEHKVVTATIAREPGLRTYSFNFGDRGMHLIPRIPRMPRIPRIPHPFRMFHGEMGMGERSGLEVEELTKQLAEFFEAPGGKGILVTEVEPGTAADSAGFKAGDVIVKAGGNPVRHIEDLRDEMMDREKKEISVEVLRKGKSLTLPLKLDTGEGDEEEDEGMSGTAPPEGHGESWIQNRLPGYHEFTARTMEALREFLREFKNDLKSGLRELHDDLQTHFSNL